MRFAIPIVLMLGVLALLGFGLTHDPREVPSPLIGKPAPAFALPRLAGNPPVGAAVMTPSLVTNAELKGRPVLVNFFASWCAACRDEHPLLMQLAQQGVEIVGIDYKDTDADGAQWLARFGNPYRTVAADSAGAMGLDWGVYGVPETYVLAADGTILFKQIGPLSEARWREKVAPLMAASAGAGS